MFRYYPLREQSWLNILLLNRKRLKMFLFIFLGVVSSVYGRQDGAPTKACSTLMPEHGDKVIAQITKAPYSVTVQEIGNSKYVVKITSHDEPFRGFVLQARSSKNPEKFIDGNFTSSKVSKTINCFDSQNNTLTHVNPETKYEVLTEWTPKQSLLEGVIFRATVAKEWDQFWTKVDSPVVFSSDKRLDDVSLAQHCYATEGCSGLPDGCVLNGNCKILLRYAKMNDTVHFAMHSYIGPSHYMAMALSTDQNMGEDSVTECIRDGTNLILRYSWNEGRTNTRTRDVPIEHVMNTFSGGLSTCRWSEPLVFDRNGQTYDLQNIQYHLLFATGVVEHDSLNHHTNRSFTEIPVNFTEYEGNATVDSFFRVPDIPYSVNDTTGDGFTSVEEIATEETTTASGRSSGFGLSFIMLVIVGMFHATKEILSSGLMNCI